ncbi:Crp/Fnr family transcriptional regulator [Leptospira langatensis]|uniref:Crp/Fnr family transcriptional regulator n=1 Tax=Leptospira langatensis TaxID=2484983 RepID=A0A5F1ZT72_9LEPT|nr:Crp/Fnr family transcriptional regulator [Leptospira langatensis]TGJ99025.1 Crp/Fnr family transcriptional regulator [Leptospira langatensis]TGL40406.1 Crp/Fnr family transcriptional regulator [Leptospira langatensis]
MEFTNEVFRAIKLSIFSSLEEEAYLPLLKCGRMVKLRAGHIVERKEGDPEYAGLVVSGFFRMYLFSGSGRQTTVRYTKQGDMMGIVGALVPEPKSGRPEDTFVQALTDSEILAISFSDLRYYGKKSAKLGWLFAEECAERVFAALRELYGASFTSVRQRLAKHLLLNATSDMEPPFLSVRLSQQSLADSIGTVREVIVRELRGLKKEGFVSSNGSRITILDPIGLYNLSEEGY